MQSCFAHSIGRYLGGSTGLASCVRRASGCAPPKLSSAAPFRTPVPFHSSSRVFLGAALGCAAAATVASSSPYRVAMADSSAPQQTAAGAARAGAGSSDTGTLKWRLYAIEGSQNVAKVMLGLDSTGTPYEVAFVNVLNRSARVKQLPTSGALVPQVQIPQRISGDGAAGERGGRVVYRALAESSDILHAIDEYNASSPNNLYPNERVGDADVDISRKINAYVLYFNHVSDAGWARSIRAVIVRMLPLGPLNNLIPLRLFYWPVYSSMREEVVKVLPDVTLEDNAMTSSLITALEPYNESLNGDPATPFLFGYSYPTAADCSLHAMVSRFVGTMGDANLPPALPDLFKLAGGRLEKLEKWQSLMTERYPMHWKRYKVDTLPVCKL